MLDVLGGAGVWQAGLEKKLVPDRTVDARVHREPLPHGGHPTWPQSCSTELSLFPSEGTLWLSLAVPTSTCRPHLQPAPGNSGFAVVRFPLFLALVKKKKLWVGIFVRALYIVKLLILCYVAILVFFFFFFCSSLTFILF